MDAIKPLSRQTKDYNWAETFAKDAAKSHKVKVLKVKANKTFITAFRHKDPEAKPVMDTIGNLIPDTDLTNYENVPYLDSIQEYFAREVLSHAPDAYLDENFSPTL